MTDHNMITVKFLPQDQTVQASAGDTLLDCALDNGIPLPHICGGNCSCTSCHVYIMEGIQNLSPMEEPEEWRLSTARNTQENSRLACQALLTEGSVTAFIIGDTDEWNIPV
jgi:2Fe-2S ferredoxin